MNGLTTLARRLQERADLAAAVVAEPPSAHGPDWGALPSLRAAVAAVPLDRVQGDDDCVTQLVQLGEALDALIATGGLDRESVLAGTAVLHERKCGRLGNLTNWMGDRPALAAARDTATAVGAALGGTLAQARAEALAGLLPHVAAIVLAEAADRRREGALVFDDLILWARDLLRDSPSARAALRARYDALLIDEFQDTDPWQASIAESFARAAGGATMDPGRLFLVGDPKQSIYRFRRADMAVYAAEQAAVREEGGLLPTLRVNRRTRDVILEWVNEVFDGLIGDGPDPALQPAYVPVEAARSVDLRGPGVAWMGEPTPDRAWDMRRAEARDVAATCRAAVAEGWEVQARDGTVRPARLGDIAVLIPTRTGLSAIEEAMRDAGVAYRVEGGNLVYRTQELRDLLNQLTAIDDPSDEVAVVAALRGPGFACSDLELAAHRAEGRRFNYLAPDLDGPGPVPGGLRRLRDHHRARHDRPLAALVERVVADMRLVEVGMVHQGTRDAYRRARFVVEQARAFEADRPRSMRAFVEWLEERTGGPVLDRDGSSLDDDEDAVRVLTVHAAKGLEFPVVIVAGIGTKPQYATPPVVSEHEGRLVAVVGTKNSGKLELGDVAAVGARETLHRDAEAARLLYVAVTRARDHLIVSLRHSEKYGQGSGASRLIEEGAREYAERWEPPDVPAAAGAAPLRASRWTCRSRRSGTPPRGRPWRRARDASGTPAPPRWPRRPRRRRAPASAGPSRTSRGAVGAAAAASAGRCMPPSRACPSPRRRTRSPRWPPPRPSPRPSPTGRTRSPRSWPRPSAPRPQAAPAWRPGRCERCPSRSRGATRWWRASSTWWCRRRAAWRSSTGRPTTCRRPASRSA